MQVIPVLDLMGGVVVRAQLGVRSTYKPIVTPLSTGADIVDIVKGLLALASFPIFYIADLDAIRRVGDNRVALQRLRNLLPEVALWIDSGAADEAAVENALRYGEVVVGTESQQDSGLIAAHPEAILSLDFRGDEYLGPREILARPEIWPERVIVMTLGRVGSGAGPDLERLSAIQVLAGARRLFAAGGLRDAGDLDVLRKMGIAGVLAASALHDGRLRPSDCS